MNMTDEEGEENGISGGRADGEGPWRVDFEGVSPQDRGNVDGLFEGSLRNGVLGGLFLQTHVRNRN